MANEDHNPGVDPAAPIEIAKAILVARNVNVLLDSDLAKLYGVTTMALNQAVKRNAARFSQDFAFRLTTAATKALVAPASRPPRGIGFSLISTSYFEPITDCDGFNFWRS
jgi:hypothetical protein